jgi:hypothetical protein
VFAWYNYFKEEEDHLNLTRYTILLHVEQGSCDIGAELPPNLPYGGRLILLGVERKVPQV